MLISEAWQACLNNQRTRTWRFDDDETNKFLETFEIIPRLPLPIFIFYFFFFFFSTSYTHSEEKDTQETSTKRCVIITCGAAAAPRASRGPPNEPINRPTRSRDAFPRQKGDNREPIPKKKTQPTIQYIHSFKLRLLILFQIPAVTRCSRGLTVSFLLAFFLFFLYHATGWNQQVAIFNRFEWFPYGIESSEAWI